MTELGSTHQSRRPGHPVQASKAERGPDPGGHRPDARAPASDQRRQGNRTAEMNIVVMVERDTHGEALIRELQRQRAAVRHVWPLPSQLPLQYDAIFCKLTNDLPQRIPWVPGEPSSALILVDDGMDPLNLDLMHNCASHGILHYPATSRMIQSVLMLARESFLYERRLRGRIEKLDESLRTMRLVERAKGLLVKLKNISEEDAYAFLRKQAMEKRVTIGMVAATVIDSYELLS